MTSNLTKREQLALDVLRAGGCFRRQLEASTYIGADSFYRIRLIDHRGLQVPGISGRTMDRLQRLGLLRCSDSPRPITCSEEYVLARAEP